MCSRSTSWFHTCISCLQAGNFQMMALHKVLHIYLILALFVVVVKCQESTVVQQTSAFTKDEMFKDILPLTSSNFSEHVLESKDAWVVIFHDGTMLKAWKSMTASVRGVVWIGMVDLKQETQMVQNVLKIDVNAIPSARIYPFGSKNEKLTKCTDVDTPNEAKLLAVQSLPDRTQRLFKADIEGFVLDSYISHPSRFPVLALIDEADTPALFKALALRFEKYYNFGVMKNPGAEDLKGIGVSHYFLDVPGLLVLIADSRKQGQLLNQHEKIDFSGIPYNKDSMGAMNYSNLMKFLFAINYQFRHVLPGDNQSNVRTVAEMEDIKEIEKERFDIIDGRQTQSKDEL